MIRRSINEYLACSAFKLQMRCLQSKMFDPLSVITSSSCGSCLDLLEFYVTYMGSSYVNYVTLVAFYILATRFPLHMYLLSHFLQYCQDGIMYNFLKVLPKCPWICYDVSKQWNVIHSEIAHMNQQNIQSVH